jgi:hypothetical protein
VLARPRHQEGRQGDRRMDPQRGWRSGILTELGYSDDSFGARRTHASVALEGTSG